MRLELLHIDEYPNSEQARERLEEALAALGRNHQGLPGLPTVDQLAEALRNNGL